MSGVWHRLGTNRALRPLIPWHGTKPFRGGPEAEDRVFSELSLPFLAVSLFWPFLPRIPALTSPDICAPVGASLPHHVASANDAARELRIASETQKLAAWLETPRWAYRLHPLPFHEACCFLDADRRCTIYETRPEVCREFAAGSEPCQRARAMMDLPPLSPVDRPADGLCRTDG